MESLARPPPAPGKEVPAVRLHIDAALVEYLINARARDTETARDLRPDHASLIQAADFRVALVRRHVVSSCTGEGRGMSEDARKSLGVTAPAVSSRMRDMVPQSGRVNPRRKRPTVAGSRSMARANAVSVIPCSVRYASSFMIDILHVKQIACQANIACHAVARPNGSDHNKNMPPVKKAKHDRAATFMKEWRKYRKLSQAIAADRTDIDTSTFSRIERGELPYNQDFLEKLALAYGCDVADILTVNPLAPDPPRLIYDRLRQVPKLKQEQALAILEAFLKAG